MQKESDYLEPFAKIPSSHREEIMSFRVYEGQFVYASTKNHVYFGHSSTLHLKETSNLLTTVAKTNSNMYSDDVYHRIAAFKGNF